MAEDDARQTAEVREVLINAVEVQLAAMAAAASFWKEWMERTSDFVKTSSQTLSSIRSEDKDASQVLLEVVDAGRESMRVMTELPRSAAERFIEELDRVEKKTKGRTTTSSRTKSTKSGKSTSRKKKGSPPKRRARVKP